MYLYLYLLIRNVQEEQLSVMGLIYSTHLLIRAEACGGPDCYNDRFWWWRNCSWQQRRLVGWCAGGLNVAGRSLLTLHACSLSLAAHRCSRNFTPSYYSPWCWAGALSQVQIRPTAVRSRWRALRTTRTAGTPRLAHPMDVHGFDVTPAARHRVRSSM